MENNTPKLRFPEFKGKWEEKKLGEILKIGSGRDYKHLGDGDIPVYGTGGLMTTVDDFLYDGETVCIGRKGTIDKPMYYDGKIWTVDTLFYTHSFKGSIPKFVYSLFQRVNWKQHNEAGGVPSLSKSTIEQIQLTLPSLSEQTKIANFLSAVDDKLSSLKKKKQLLEQYKKGVMQQIFSQQLRFKDDNGEDFAEWEEKKLGDMISLVIDNRGKTPPTIEVGIPLLEVNSIGNKEINYKAVSKYVTTETYNNWFRKYLEQGDILFSTVGNTALCSYFDGSKKAGIAQNIVGLRFKNEFSLFMYYLLIEERNRNKFKQIEMGAVQPSVKVSQMVDLYFDVPTFSEQTKIANFLSAIDEKISHCGVQIEKMEGWKKGLLQQMFV